jgi:pyruvate/2-oxoacid:ferredoxin oxidoreductase beta subunit
MQQALAGLDLPPHQVAIFGGIGCSGKAPYYLPAYGIHTLHGRVLAYATGATLTEAGVQNGSERRLAPARRSQKRHAASSDLDHAGMKH